MKPRTIRASSAGVALLLCAVIAPAPAAAADSGIKLASWSSSVDYRLPMAQEGLPEGAPREGVLITVDAEENVLYLFKDGELVAKDKAATGMNKTLKGGERTWLFRTPRGIVKVLNKIVDPIWTKPDWAFVEKGEKVPPIDSPKRKEKGTLGEYALDLGDGILIHGTKDLDSLGQKASHGCIRLGPRMLELVYEHADVGTPVYVY